MFDVIGFLGFQNLFVKFSASSFWQFKLFFGQLFETFALVCFVILCQFFFQYDFSLQQITEGAISIPNFSSGICRLVGCEVLSYVFECN